jgi:hypothetical protein
LLFAVLMVPFYLLYWIVLSLLEQHPLIERLIRLTLILGAMMIALCWGLQWAMRARFGTWSLKVTTPQISPDSGTPNPNSGLTLRQAAKVVWAEMWRYAVIGAPLTIALSQVRFGRQVSPLSDWQSFLQVESVNIPLALLISTWAMRQALSLNYGDFRLQWTDAAPTPIDIADSQSDRHGGGNIQT